MDEEEKKPNLITTRITQTSKHSWDPEDYEFHPKYRIDVSRRANRSGRSWTETRRAWTYLGARRQARKIIKEKSRVAFEYKTIYEKSVRDYD